MPVRCVIASALARNDAKSWYIRQRHSATEDKAVKHKIVHLKKKPVKVVEALSHLLADTYILYLKTQNFHWNVTGENFVTLHKLF